MKNAPRLKRREKRELNNRQRDFLIAYEKTGDVEKSAVMAGFAPKYGWQLRKTFEAEINAIDIKHKQNVSEYSARLLAWSDDELLVTLINAMRFGADSFYYDEPDEYGINRAKPLKELSAAQRSIIQKITNRSVKVGDTHVIVQDYELISKEFASQRLAQTFGTFDLAKIAEKMRTSKEKVFEAKLKAVTKNDS